MYPVYMLRNVPTGRSAHDPTMCRALPAEWLGLISLRLMAEWMVVAMLLICTLSASRLIRRLLSPHWSEEH